MSNTAIFLDTTVQMLRFIGSRDVKTQISNQLSRFGITITSLVVRQEFKRRFLTDVRYLKTALEKTGFDCEATLRYLNEKLNSPHNRRKLSVCLDVFAGAAFNGRPVQDRGEKLHLLLQSWENNGLAMFDKSVGQVVQYSRCGCALESQLGPKKCSSAKICGITQFIQSKDSISKQILNFLANCTAPPKSTEIQKAETALNKWLLKGGNPIADNPCLTVGDLIVALESHGVPVFYTKNARESQFFCNALEQTMIVLRSNGDEECSASNRGQWPMY